MGVEEEEKEEEEDEEGGGRGAEARGGGAGREALDPSPLPTELLLLASSIPPPFSPAVFAAVPLGAVLLGAGLALNALLFSNSLALPSTVTCSLPSPSTLKSRTSLTPPGPRGVQVMERERVPLGGIVADVSPLTEQEKPLLVGILVDVRRRGVEEGDRRRMGRVRGRRGRLPVEPKSR